MLNTSFGPTPLLALAGLLAVIHHPASVKPRDAREQPFSSSSIWNTPIGDRAAYQRPGDPKIQLLRDEDAGGYRRAVSWISADSVAIYRASERDPTAPWSYKSRAATAPWPQDNNMVDGVVRFQTPSTIRFLGKSDKLIIIISPDGHTAHEAWLGEQLPGNSGFRSAYLADVDLYGTGTASADGSSEGLRAFGGSLAGGLIRCSELRRAEIPHAVAVNLSSSQLRRGTPMSNQMVWPATMTDNRGQNSYSGLVPMGALLAIPPWVDIDKLGLSREGKALARAYQDFGGYVVDQSSDTMLLAQVVAGCRVEQLLGDMAKIRAQLTLVTNNTRQYPGGPGRRRRPLVPPLAATR